MATSTPIRRAIAACWQLDEVWQDASMAIAVRPARAGDEAALADIERETWSPLASPGAYSTRPFFTNLRPDQVLVAVLDQQVVGYICLKPPTSLPSNAHVLMVTALAVKPSAQRRGVAGTLLEAAEGYAAERNAERLTLHVLSANTGARSLYERHGYRTEGELHGEFRLPLGSGGALLPVDDVLMARTIDRT